MKKAANSEQPVASSMVRDIPVGELMVSVEETRKTVDQDALKELAASIAERGVTEPLLVRPMQGYFEIVSGQRRWLASKLAGKTTCPCNVREMSETEAAELRIVLNDQREDLPPMQQAEAYGKLLEEPGATIESVALKLAKSPSYVGRRLKLLDAIEPVREALKVGAIEVGHALELARLDEAMQRRLLTRMQCGVSLVEPDDIEDETGAEDGVCRFCGCTEDDACPGGCSWANEEQTVCDAPKCLERFRAETGQEETQWHKTHFSVVELRREIGNTSLVDLRNAPFPLIADLPPVPCTDCPKRAGNAQLLFDDCAQDTCTDRPCFNRKVNAWIEAELAAAKAEKRKLLKLTDSWSNDKDEVYVSRYHGVFPCADEDPCENSEEGIYIDGRRAGERATVCRKKDCKKHGGAGSRGPSSGNRRIEASPKEQEKRKALLAKVKAKREYRVRLFRAIAAVKVPTVTPAMLVALVEYAISCSDGTLRQKACGLLGWDEKLFSGYGPASEKKIKDHLGALSAGDAVRAALLFTKSSDLTVNEYASDAKPQGLEALAQMFGVDLKGVRAGFIDGKPAPSEVAVRKAALVKSKSATPAPAKKAAKKPAKKVAKKGGRK